MANTYTQIHIQAVFAVQNRTCVISKKWEDNYISTSQVLFKRIITNFWQ